jgi:hypothetical protein
MPRVTLTEAQLRVVRVAVGTVGTLADLTGEDHFNGHELRSLQLAAKKLAASDRWSGYLRPRRVVDK